MKWLSAITATLLTFAPMSAYAVATLADTRNLTLHFVHAPSTSDSFSYTVPSGTNQTFFVVLAEGTDNTPSATLNGASLTFTEASATCSPANVAAAEWYGYVVAPTTGTFSLSGISAGSADYLVGTFNGSDQTTPIDKASCSGRTSVTTVRGDITPPSANTFLIDFTFIGVANNGSSHGGGQTEYASFDDSAVFLGSSYDSTTNGSTTASTAQTMTEVWGSAHNTDIVMLAIKPAAAAAALNPQSFFTW